MSKKHLTISDQVMDKIRDQKIQMRPKIYYILGSIIVFVSLILSIFSTVFLISLTRFSLRTHGPMGQIRFEQLLTSFPWWAPILAIIGLIIGIKMLGKYDFSYKHDFKLIILGFIFAVIIAGWGIDALGMDDVLFRQGPMNGIMRQYRQQQGYEPGQGLRKRGSIAP